MPRIAKNLEACVFFLYGHNPMTGEIVGPGGTGFFVATCSKVLDNIFHVYAVSNRHVVQNSACIRVNRFGSGTELHEFDPSEWVWSEADDLAAIDVTDLIPYNPWSDDGALANSAVHDYQLINQARAWSKDVGIGDQTVMLGLFADYTVPDRNVPVARFGFIAAVPDEKVPVSLWKGDLLARPAYLNDMRSRSGFSGSPVWVWRTPYDDMNEVGVNGLAQRFNPRNTLFGLLGIHRGQFRERTAVNFVEADRPLVSGDLIEVASAMTVVVPAWEIETLLQNERFQEQRSARDALPARIALSAAITEELRRPG